MQKKALIVLLSVIAALFFCACGQSSSSQSSNPSGVSSVTSAQSSKSQTITASETAAAVDELRLSDEYKAYQNAETKALAANVEALMEQGNHKKIDSYYQELKKTAEALPAYTGDDPRAQKMRGYMTLTALSMAAAFNCAEQYAFAVESKDKSAMADWKSKYSDNLKDAESNRNLYKKELAALAVEIA